MVGNGRDTEDLEKARKTLLRAKADLNNAEDDNAILKLQLQELRAKFNDVQARPALLGSWDTF